MRLLITVLLALALALVACEPMTPSSDSLQKKRIEQQVAQAEKAVPPPRVTKFTQLRDATRITEIADDNITTWAYYMDLNGKLHLLCEAKGYGLPYSTQTTNPDKISSRSSYGIAILPQAEPSGLFMPDNVAATWVLCANDEDEFDAVYWEPDLVVSPFPLKHATSLRR